MHDLAIIIPAYKEPFLYEALESLARQDDLRFKVYVGDDASPANLKEIVDQFTDRLDISYHRFSENLGGTSLAQQWNRCVRMSAEPWGGFSPMPTLLPRLRLLLLRGPRNKKILLRRIPL